MQDLLSILFYIRKSRNKNATKATVYLRITYSGKRAEASTFLSVPLGKWNAKANKVMGHSAEAKRVNHHLDILRKHVFRAYQELLDQEEEISAIRIRNRLVGLEESRHNILEVFETHNQKMEQLVGKDFSFRTLQRYKTTKSHLTEFIKAEYNLEDMSVKRVELTFINAFIYFLKTEKDLAHNSAMKYLAYFKKIVRICYANGWIDQDPFYNFKVRLQQKEREFLTRKELVSIIQKEFRYKRLEQVRDLFIFSCYTGLSYSDVCKLTPDDIVLGIDGDQWLRVKRTKTGTISNIPLLEMAQEIIEKYRDQELPNNALLPHSSNQKTNSFLKEIAVLCGITKDLTFHMARHTFATTVTLANGVPIESVSKMLGHRSIKTTQHYAKIIDRKLGEDVGLLKEKLKQLDQSSSATK
ncbi:site-specific integrase [Robertkochia sediminum]|uniref:site-specific integrase n=1 Tax=Robertkochia sediminum TaxID=2785326 RepID=UPI00193148D0|nr:site-specific integrase [Robertkochia sediminum]MBL7472230.1 site-specific integrase [Robertkochia sediminum]